MKSNILLLFSFIKIIISEICNYSFSCNLNENDDYCAIRKRTDSNTIFEINVKKCASTSCNIYDTLLGDTEKKTACQNSSMENIYKYPSYPGGVCKKEQNCLSGICINDICVNSIQNKCYNHENCPLNTACIKGSCQPYLKTNSDSECEDSYQCEFNAYCNKKEKKCKLLFDIGDGIDITDYTLPGERIENICINGSYINLKDEESDNIHRYCETLMNIDQNCNEDCNYKRLSNGQNYNQADKCLCGYNKYRTKYCVLGNGEEIYQDFLKLKKKFINNIELTKYCHTLERDFDDICLELLNTRKSVDFRNFVKEYNNKKILALQHHRLQESDSCIKEVIFNYDTSPVFSLNQKCPKYSCNFQKENCFYGNNPLQENGENITVILNPNSCNEKEFCTLPEENKLINTSLIMENENLIGQCKIYQGKKGIKRYPGEPCNINSDCLLENSICNNGICNGTGEGGECNETKQCTVGLYCNKKDKKCVKQKDEGGICVEAWDCKNYLGCFRGKCIKLGTLKKGIKITNDMAPFPGEDKRYYLCETGELNEGDGTTGNFCVVNDYDNNWVNANNKDIDNNNYIKCTFGEVCVYNNGKNKIYKSCECGYNSEGQGYCPLPSSRNLENWKNRIKFIGDSANNECHSLSRYNCYKNNDYEYYVKQREHESKTTQIHLYYNSVDCAYKMFVNQNNLQFNYYLISLFLALLI